MSAPVFLIADVRVINESKYEDYRRALRRAIEGHGGRYLAGDQKPKVIEGGWTPAHMMIVEFPGSEAAQQFCASDAYRAAGQLSHNCAMVDMVLAEGMKAARHAGAASTPAYAVADTHVVNRARFEALSQPINDAVHSYHGRHLVWSAAARTIEGNWAPVLLTLLEFPDYSAAVEIYASPAYRETHELLSNAAMIDLLLLQGVGADAG
jgi:uncharacterized protein (DUF1330 family)